MELFPGDGCGNRFLVGREQEFAAAARGRGVEPGALAGLCSAAADVDGVLLVAVEPARMRVRILNRDGSDGGACLNGLRVAALWGGADRGVLEMAGREVDWHRERGGVALELPLDAAALAVEDLTARLPAGGLLHGQAVAFWNPHAVFQLADADRLADFPLAAFAAAVRADRARFPDGVNVSVAVREAPGRLRVRVDERGVGETAACGSAAVALAAACWQGAGPQRLEVRMGGGSLDLERLPGGRTGLRGAARVARARRLEDLLASAHNSRS